MKLTLPILSVLILIMMLGPTEVQALPQAGQEELPDPQALPVEDPSPQAPGARVIETPFGNTVVEAPPEVPALEVTPGVPEQPPAGAQVAQAEQGVPPGLDDPSPVQLDLDSADIYQVIRIIDEALGLNYVIDPTVEGTVNISTSESLRRSDLLPILETILKINGASMVRNGNFYEIVPVANEARAPLEVQIAQAGLAPGDEMIIQVVRLKFVSATEISAFI